MRQLVVAIAVLGGVDAAVAEGFLEPHLGVAIPIADDDYEDAADNSLKLGLRFGGGSPSRSLDVSADWTLVGDNLSNGFVDVDVSRYRILVGGRGSMPIGAGNRARLVGRIAAGVDIVRYHAEGNIIGIPVDQSETDLGLAVELGGGVLFDIGRVSVGGWVGVPLAFHFEEDDPNDQADADLEYTGVDLDFLFVVSVPL